MNIAKFKPRILDILRSSDLDTITTKSVRKILQHGTSEPLDEYKKELNALIMQCVDMVNDPTLQTVKKESPTGSGSGGDGSNKYNYSSSQATTTTTTSSIDPSNRPASPPPRPRSSTSNKKRTSELVHSDDEDGATTTTTSKKKKKSTSKTVKKPTKKRNVDPATLQKNPFTKSWMLSDTLSSILGETVLSRPGVVKALWKYIKQNELQDPTNKTYIICDENLKRIFDGQDRIHCFTMNKFIGKHLSDLPADYVLDGGMGVKDE